MVRLVLFPAPDGAGPSHSEPIGVQEPFKQDATQREARGRPLAPRRAWPVFVTVPSVLDDRPGIKWTGTASADLTAGAEHRDPLMELKFGSRFRVVSRMRKKREQMNRLILELKVQLQTERFGLLKVDTGLITARFNDRSGPGRFGSEPQVNEPTGIVRQESNGELRCTV